MDNGDMLNDIERNERINTALQGFDDIEVLIPRQTRLYWQTFLSLQRQGFTEHQALDILKARGATLG